MLNYCPVIWHFYSEANTKKMERALKFKYNENYSTCDELLVRSTLSSLKIRRIRTIAIETLKIINKESLQYIQYVLPHVKKKPIQLYNQPKPYF